MLSQTVPNCLSYDPAYGYEIAVIVQEGLRRMIGEQDDVFYYLTIANENYPHPEMPKGAEEGILKGMYRVKEAGGRKKPAVRLLGSGPILREALAAAEMLKQDWDLEAEVWSVTSYTQLRRDGLAAEREARLHGADERRPSLGRGVPGQRARRAGRRDERLHEGAARRHPRVGPRAIRRARNRRLRP